MRNELSLPARTLQGHDRSTSRISRDRRTEIASNHVQAQIQTRNRPSRGQDLAVVDIEHFGINFDCRIAACKLSGGLPVRRCTETVQAHQPQPAQRLPCRRMQCGRRA